MREDLKSIYRRLEKLLKIVQDGRGDPAETAAAAHQAETIMRKYQIDESEIVLKELQQEQHFSHFDVGSVYDQAKTNVKTPQQNLGKLSVGIARLNDCQALFVHDSLFGQMIRFRGYTPDVMVCKFTFRYVLNQLKLASRNVRHPLDFQNGYIHEVIESLKRAHAEKQQEAQSNSRSLVVIKKNAVDSFFGPVNYVKTHIRVGNESAYSAGRAAGAKLDVLLRGVGHTPQSNTVRIK